MFWANEFYIAKSNIGATNSIKKLTLSSRIHDLTIDRGQKMLFWRTNTNIMSIDYSGNGLKEYQQSTSGSTGFAVYSEASK